MNSNDPVHLYKLLNALSLAMDFSKKGLMNHHQRVALLSLRIADTIELPEASKRHLFCSAVIHDAGTSTWQEKTRLETFNIEDPWDHCQRGYNLIKQMEVLAPIARIILCHHDRWEGSNPSGLAGEKIPIESRIIHLADRVDVLAHDKSNILNHRDNIVTQIRKHAKILFDPWIVDAFTGLAEKESLWLDLNSRFIRHHLDSFMVGCTMNISYKELIQVSEMFARIIDGKSPFTHRHSRLVAEIAAFLAGKMGFEDHEMQDMKVAGLLHDLGKLTIPDEILEKPGKLSRYEFNIIKQHTYYTFQILNLVEGLETINQWASYHHEKLNGRGYPFHIEAENLCLGSRIMTVSDIYSALVEDRPYRPGLPREKILEIIDQQVKEGAIDGEVVSILKENIDKAEEIAHSMNSF